MTLPRITLSLFVLIALVFGLSRALPFALGPSLTVHTPENGKTVDGVVTVTGEVLRAQKISVNGLPITQDAEGRFETALLPPLGHSILLVQAEDRFGRTTEKKMQIIIKESTYGSTEKEIGYR